ncbi:MAG: hypothetical protein Q9221_003071 [Calogaya cf. arnoldii]
MTPLFGLALGICGLLVVASAYDVTSDWSFLQDTTLAKRARVFTCNPDTIPGPGVQIVPAYAAHLPSDARAACDTEQDAEAANDAQPANNNNGAAASANPCPVTTADQSSRKEFDRPVCSAWYGEPVLSDCQTAWRSLSDQQNAYVVYVQMGEEDLVDIADYDWPATTWEDFQDITPFQINFALAGKLAQLMQRYSVVQPDVPSVDFIDPPLTATQGLCTISILPAEIPDLGANGRSAVGGELEMFTHATKAVIEQCVVSQRKGGWVSTDPEMTLHGLSPFTSITLPPASNSFSTSNTPVTWTPKAKPPATAPMKTNHPGRNQRLVTIQHSVIQARVEVALAKARPT